jgi:hypothetical protein
MIPENDHISAPVRFAIIAFALLVTFAVCGFAIFRLTQAGKEFYYNHMYYGNANLIAVLISGACLGSLICVRLWLKSFPALFSANSRRVDWRWDPFKFVAILLGIVFVALCLPATFLSIGDTGLVVPHWIDDSITIDQIMNFLAGNYSVPVYRFTQGWLLFLTTTISASGLSWIFPIGVSYVDGFMRIQQLLILFSLIVATFVLFFRITGSYWFSIGVVLISYSDVWIFFTAVRDSRLDNLQLLVIVLFFYFALGFYSSGSPRDWYFTVFFASMAFAVRYSGHLLVPTLCALFIIHCADKSVLGRFKSRAEGIKGCAWLIIAGTACMFILTFFVFNPYHLLGFDDFVSTVKDMTGVYSKSLEFHDLKAMDKSLLAAWWHALVAEETPEVFSKPWLELVTARSIMVVLCAMGTLTAIWRMVARLLKGRDLGPQGAVELLFLIWLTSYWSFLLFQFRGRFILRAYIEPVFFVMSYFALVPLFWLYQAAHVRVHYLFKFSGVSIAAIACGFIFWYGSQTFKNSLGDLAIYRNPNSDAMEVGRFIDNRIPKDLNPPILNSHFAYIPTRFSDVIVHNVDVTADFIGRNRFEFLIIDDFLFDYLADIDMTGREDLIYPRFNVKYSDVTKVYTALKNDKYPGYRLVARLGQFSVFQSEWLNKRVPIEWNLSADKANADVVTVSRIQPEASTEYFVEKIGTTSTRQFSFPIEGLTRSGTYLMTGSMVFTNSDADHRLYGASVGVLSESENRYLVHQLGYGRKKIDFSLRFSFRPENGPIRFVVTNAGRPPREQFALKSLRLDELVWKERASLIGYSSNP